MFVGCRARLSRALLLGRILWQLGYVRVAYGALNVERQYSAGQNVYLPVFCFEGLISEFPKFTYRFPSLRASFSSQVKKNRKPD